jgi:hypothetical protein
MFAAVTYIVVVFEILNDLPATQEMDFSAAARHNPYFSTQLNHLCNILSHLQGGFPYFIFHPKLLSVYPTQYTQTLAQSALISYIKLGRQG